MRTIGESFTRISQYGFLAPAVALAWLFAPAPAAAQPQQTHYVQVAGLFGDSDEEIAARQQREQAQDASIANLSQRVVDLEHTLRQLTGQLEEANHQNAVLQQKIERMQKDFDYRLCKLSAQQLGASGNGDDESSNDSGGALNCGMTGGSQAMPQQFGAAQPPPQSASGGSVTMGRPSGVLGTLPAGTSAPRPRDDVTVNMSAVGGAQAQPSGESRDRFNSAMNLLAKAQYDEASNAFGSFAETYPKDDLAPQAVYWVGAIAYMQKNYSDAARAFAQEIKEYPDSPRAPESMLKLGRSLIAMKQKQEGCTTLGALSSKYPKASQSVRHEASEARHEARCH